MVVKKMNQIQSENERKRLRLGRASEGIRVA
jgi:hypothetical protein